MNCKPGDLAIVCKNIPSDDDLSLEATALRFMRGKVVHCLRIKVDDKWAVDHFPIFGCEWGRLFWGIVTAIGDEHLMPISADPVSETLMHETSV